MTLVASRAMIGRMPEIFRPFSTLHAVMVATCAFVIAAACAMAWRAKRKGLTRSTRWERWWGWSIVLSQAVIAVWWLLPDAWNLESRLNIERAVPLNLCRLVVWIAALAMLSSARWPRSLLYFWGLGLSTHAFVTPVFEEGPAQAVFWVFWLGHAQIVGTAVYDVVVRGFRPRCSDFTLAASAGLAYAAVVIAVNATWHTGYAGLGRATFDLPNLAKSLGHWPWRPLWIVCLALAWFVIIWRAWSFVPRLWSRATGIRTPPRANSP